VPRAKRRRQAHTLRSTLRVLYVVAVLTAVVTVGSSPALKARLLGSSGQHSMVAASSSAVPVVVLPDSMVEAVRAACVAWPIDNSPGCTKAALGEVNYARANEGVGALTLSAGWAGLSVDEQTFVVVNQERVGRGLSPYLGLSHGLDALARGGAVSGGDPNLPRGAWGESIWAGGYNSVLLADYDWMYNDGPAGPNADCPLNGDGGCWGHRAAILLACANCSMGVGWVGGSASSLAAEFVGGWGGPLYYRAAR
jgi:hypothetical protein